MKRFMTKKVLVVGVAVAVALGVGGAAFAYFTTTGSGTGNAAIGDASPLTVTLGPITGGALFPTIVTDGNAIVDTVPYTVTNPGEGNVNLGTVVMEVTPGFDYVDGTGDPACTAADFSINGQTVGTPATLTGLNKTLNGVSDAPNNAYSGSFTIEMVENGANQDSCQSGSVPLTVTVNTPVPTANLLSSIAWYTLTQPGGTWTRYASPTSLGVDAQSVGVGGAVTLSITGATAYSDNGFYMVLGTLGSLNGYTITGTGSSFGDNLYFGTNSGEFFLWNAGGTTAGLGVTAYGLGPTSVGGTVTVTGSSTFGMSNPLVACPYSETFTQLKGGACGLTASTPVALWVGDTVSPSGSATTTITSVTAP